VIDQDSEEDTVDAVSIRQTLPGRDLSQQWHEVYKRLAGMKKKKSKNAGGRIAQSMEAEFPKTTMYVTDWLTMRNEFPNLDRFMLFWNHILEDPLVQVELQPARARHSQDDIFRSFFEYARNCYKKMTSHSK